MRPKSKCQKKKVPPKNVKAYRLDLVDDFAATILSSDKSKRRSDHYDGIKDQTLILHKEIVKMQESLAKIIEMQQEFLENQKKIQDSQQKIKKELQDFKNRSLAYESREKWLLENGVNLPMKTMEEFTKYCSLIKQSPECRKILETSVHFAVNGKKSLTKNISAVVRKYCTAELANQFTVVKSVQGKTVLGDTPFYEHLLRYFLEKSAVGILPTGLIESDFNKALGGVLCNAKDWNNRKLIRPAK